MMLVSSPLVIQINCDCPRNQINLNERGDENLLVILLSFKREKSLNAANAIRKHFCNTEAESGLPGWRISSLAGVDRHQIKGLSKTQWPVMR